MKLKRNLAVIAASLLLAGSFFLPNAVAAITDSGRIDNLTMIDAQTISFDSVPDLSLPDKIVLMANKNTEIMALSSGNVMDEETAGSRVVTELSQFFSGSLYGFEIRSCTVQESSAAFVIDPENPRFNMIIWELTITDALENAAAIVMDDETGKIIKIVYKQGMRTGGMNAGNDTPLPVLSNIELHRNALRVTEMMAEYYDLPIILGDYHFNGSYSYYRADFADGSRIVSMFGVVRSTGVTMNER